MTHIEQELADPLYAWSGAYCIVWGGRFPKAKMNTNIWFLGRRCRFGDRAEEVEFQ